MDIGSIINRVCASIRWRWEKFTLPRFFGKSAVNLVINMPRQIINPENIVLGANITLGAGCVIHPMKSYKCYKGIERYSSLIKIGNNVQSTGALQVYAVELVEIGDAVLFANNVFISDCSHGFESLSHAIVDQPLNRIAPVVIGEHSWIGQNCVILPGVTIGRHCVVGANSVVTRSIPDYSVAVGSPAKVIRQISFEQNDCKS